LLFNEEPGLVLYRGQKYDIGGGKLASDDTSDNVMPRSQLVPSIALFNLQYMELLAQ